MKRSARLAQLAEQRCDMPQVASSSLATRNIDFGKLSVKFCGLLVASKCSLQRRSIGAMGITATGTMNDPSPLAAPFIPDNATVPGRIIWVRKIAVPTVLHPRARPDIRPLIIQAVAILVIDDPGVVSRQAKNHPMDGLVLLFPLFVAPGCVGIPRIAALDGVPMFLGKHGKIGVIDNCEPSIAKVDEFHRKSQKRPWPGWPGCKLRPGHKPCPTRALVFVPVSQAREPPPA